MIEVIKTQGFVEVVRVGGVTRVVERPKRIEVIENSRQGPPGPPGGSSTYKHPQTTPAAVWTVAHNMHKRPSVTVTDHLGNVVLADVSYVDDDIIQVTHATPMIGNVYCN